MNGVMASALTVHLYYLILTLLGKGSKALEALTKVIYMTFVRAGALILVQDWTRDAC